MLANHSADNCYYSKYIRNSHKSKKRQKLIIKKDKGPK